VRATQRFGQHTKKTKEAPKRSLICNQPPTFVFFFFCSNNEKSNYFQKKLYFIWLLKSLLVQNRVVADLRRRKSIFDRLKKVAAKEREE
jgi:hypothetical protein